MADQDSDDMHSPFPADPENDDYDDYEDYGVDKESMEPPPKRYLFKESPSTHEVSYI
jgi:hypothetical protein